MVKSLVFLFFPQLKWSTGIAVGEKDDSAMNKVGRLTFIAKQLKPMVNTMLDRYEANPKKVELELIEQADALLRKGCKSAQGWYFHKPLEPEVFTKQFAD